MPDPKKKKARSALHSGLVEEIRESKEASDSLRKHGVASFLRAAGRDARRDFNEGRGKSQQATGDPDPGAAKRKLRLKAITDSVDKKIAPAMKGVTAKIAKKAEAAVDAARTAPKKKGPRTWLNHSGVEETGPAVPLKKMQMRLKRLQKSDPGGDINLDRVRQKGDDRQLPDATRVRDRVPPPLPRKTPFLKKRDEQQFAAGKTGKSRRA